jgi:hypothetical protein
MIDPINDPTGRKASWAARAAMLHEAAAKNDAKAQGLYQASRPTDDPAFWTQPGRNPARLRANNASQRAFDLERKAQEQRSRAGQLERLANTNRGDAQAARDDINGQARALWISRGLKKGMQVESATYGHEATVARVNAKTVTLRFASGFEDRQPFFDVVKLIHDEPSIANG